MFGDKIKGRHWVFIIGIVCASMTGIWNTDVALEMLNLLLIMGVGIALVKY